MMIDQEVANLRPMRPGFRKLITYILVPGLTETRTNLYHAV
jgi:hypothetical protein